MKKILMSLIMIVAVASVATGATKAYFSDTETSTGNTFTAGTLDLKVNNEDDPITMKFQVSDMKPGDDTGYKIWCLKNTGSIPGQPYVDFSAVSNDDNNCNEPEGSADSTCGAGQGELGQYAKYVIGVGPCNWTVPSLLISQSETGPAHPWGIPGLNGLAGNTYFKGPTGYKFPVLNPGDTYGFFMKASIDSNVRRWTGTGWVEADDNIIQSDSASLDITFHLDQVTP